MSYDAAMARDRERLSNAHKRNLDHSKETAGGGEQRDGEDVEGAWNSVFESSKAVIPDEREEARKRKIQKKVDKRAEKRANENANAGNWSVYVGGIPKDLAYTAVHGLFSKVSSP